MTKFRDDNTEGFNADELAVLNEAFNTLVARDAQSDDYGYDDDTDDMMAFIEKHIADGLTNAWLPGMDVATLVAAYDAR